MKLWDKGTDVNKAIEKFTVGRDRELDLLLAPYDVLGSLAHTIMLEKVNLLSTEELPQIRKALVAIYKNIEEGKFEIEDGIEDVHSQVELLLTRSLGDAGKKNTQCPFTKRSGTARFKTFFKSENCRVSKFC